MQEAIHYEKVELIPGIICDGYVLNDGTAVMSERGITYLLGIGRMALHRMEPKWPPKTLKPLIDKASIMAPNLIDVVSALKSKSHEDYRAFKNTKTVYW